MVKNHPNNIAIGKNKGHPTTKLQKKSVRPVSSKAKLGKRVKLIREVANEVSGVSVYEKRAI